MQALAQGWLWLVTKANLNPSPALMSNRELAETMQISRYSAAHGFKAGAVGGLVGSLVLGALAGLSAFVLDQEVFYVSVAKSLGLGSPVFTGWALHFLTGVVAGGVFVGITGLISRFTLDTKRKSFWVGLLEE